VRDLDGYGQPWQEQNRRRADYHLHWPDRPYREELTILVAGCGTSQAAKHALRQPAARVVGIDVSETSIRHTRELQRRYGLTNLELHQLPIERVSVLGRRFDKIVCTGVLHHLPDPDAGLHALAEALAPDGALQLMVYATYGRAGVYMLQEYCRLLNIGASDAEVRTLAAALMALPDGHPLAPLLGQAPDFRTVAGLADALLHPQDRAYTVPELFDLIDRADLALARWLRQAPYLPQCGVLAQSPHSAQLARLAPPQQYAAAELFRGVMLRHTAILVRRDRPGGHASIRFDDDRWRHWAPLRMPETVCLEERLPPGAAAVLINRGHTDPDLALPLDAAEKPLFDAIDGQRTITAIADAVAAPGAGNSEFARALFERLWRYDHVVFDTSRTQAAR
jgi:2-polyprenyl-3-methyl-5-hydroxy-6-metoxy-1,4-benzoquinol methylase